MDLKQQEQAENAVVNTVNQLQIQTKNPHLEGAMIVADYHLRLKYVLSSVDYKQNMPDLTEP